METNKAREYTVGELVRLSIPGMNGPMKVAGTVKRIVHDFAGRAVYEVKTQIHGYCQKRAEELTPSFARLEREGERFWESV